MPVEFAGAVSVSVTGTSVTVTVGVAASKQGWLDMLSGLYCFLLQYSVTKIPLILLKLSTIIKG